MEPFISELPRTFWVVTDLEEYNSMDHNPYQSGMEVCEPATPETANTIASLLEGSVSLHAPCVDIDWPSTLTSHMMATELYIRCMWPTHRQYNDDEGGSTMVPVEPGQLDVWCRQLAAFNFVFEVNCAARADEGMNVRILFNSPTGIVLLPSKSPEHFHLFIEQIMTWEQYKVFITLLQRIGVVQFGFSAMTERREMSHLRIPSTELFVVSMTANSSLVS